MDCGQIQSLFTSYQDGELDQRNLLPFERHLASCPLCAREWQDFRGTLRLLQGVKPLPVPPDLLPGIHEKLARRNQGNWLGRVLKKMFTPVPLTAAASLTAAVLAATLVIRTYTVPVPSQPTASPPARIAQVDRGDLMPPLATMPVSLGRPAGSSFNPASPISDPERSSSYQAALEHEGIEISPLGHFLSLGEPAAPRSSGWQIGPPLVPDVTIRMHHLSPEGMKWLHNRIKEEGHWQTRFYSQDYFLVLVDPSELSTLYNLLQRQHLPFSSRSLPRAEQAVQKPLLIAVRP